MFTAFKEQSILHFLIMGLILTLVYTFALKRFDFEGNGDESIMLSEAQTIISASEQNILAFLQYREKAFNQAQAREQLNAMSKNQKAQLIEDFMLEEVLVREAKAMALDSQDYVIRSRMVQKMEYLTEGFVKQATEPDEQEIYAYFQANVSDYQQQANASFTHIFFKADQAIKARKALKLLNEGSAQASEFGQAFLYQRYYLKRPIDLISSHFGEAFSEQLFALPSDSATWQGPIESKHGIHLVLLNQVEPAQTPAFEDVIAIVAHDAGRAKTKQQTRLLFKELVAKYTLTNSDWHNQEQLSTDDSQQSSGAMP